MSYSKHTHNRTHTKHVRAHQMVACYTNDKPNEDFDF